MYKVGDKVIFYGGVPSNVGKGIILELPGNGRCNSCYKIHVLNLKDMNYAWLDDGFHGCDATGPSTGLLCRWVDPEEIIKYAITPRGNTCK